MVAETFTAENESSFEAAWRGWALYEASHVGPVWSGYGGKPSSGRADRTGSMLGCSQPLISQAAEGSRKALILTALPAPIPATYASSGVPPTGIAYQVASPRLTGRGSSWGFGHSVTCTPSRHIIVGLETTSFREGRCASKVKALGLT